jgi:hypothetical protein
MLVSQGFCLDFSSPMQCFQHQVWTRKALASIEAPGEAEHHSLVVGGGELSLLLGEL